jgi:predicted DNA-binding transcriptional regulator AlpA
MEKMLRTAEVAERLRVSPNTVSRWSRELPGFPAPILAGPRTRLWPESAIDNYVENELQVTELPVTVVGNE